MLFSFKKKKKFHTTMSRASNRNFLCWHNSPTIKKIYFQPLWAFQSPTGLPTPYGPLKALQASQSPMGLSKPYGSPKALWASHAPERRLEVLTAPACERYSMQAMVKQDRSEVGKNKTSHGKPWSLTFFQ